MSVSHFWFGASEWKSRLSRFSGAGLISPRYEPCRRRSGVAAHAELGFRVTEAVEHHDANQRLDINAVAGAAEHAPQVMEAKLFPQVGQRPDIAKGTRRLEADGSGFGWGEHHWIVASDLEQTDDHRIDAALQILHPAEGGQCALFGLAGLIAVGLYELDVLAGSGTGSLDEHAATKSRRKSTEHYTIDRNVPI